LRGDRKGLLPGFFFSVGMQRLQSLQAALAGA
jgi:hypothetical protein